MLFLLAGQLSKFIVLLFKEHPLKFSSPHVYRSVVVYMRKNSVSLSLFFLSDWTWKGVYYTVISRLSALSCRHCRGILPSASAVAKSTVSVTAIYFFCFCFFLPNFQVFITGVLKYRYFGSGYKFSFLVFLGYLNLKKGVL